MKATIVATASSKEQKKTIGKFKLQRKMDLRNQSKIAWQNFDTLEAARNHMLVRAAEFYNYDQNAIQDHKTEWMLTLGCCTATIMTGPDRINWLRSHAAAE